jgi:hypothetical protein
MSLRRMLFLGVEHSRGNEYLVGTFCGAFIIDPSQCVVEEMRYSGGFSAASMGWAGRVAIGGVRPRLGFGVITAQQHGQDTGGRSDETKAAVLAGAAVEVSRHIPRIGLAVTASAGADRIRPVVIGECEDCRYFFREALSQRTLGIRLSWRPAR